MPSLTARTTRRGSFAGGGLRAHEKISAVWQDFRGAWPIARA